MILNRSEIDRKLNHSFNQRQLEIIEIIREEGTVKVSKLSKYFKVSEETIRRDFEKLENENLIKRIHGGAVHVEKTSSKKVVLNRGEKNRLEKDMIAMKAASFVNDGDIIGMDASTTTLGMTKYLKGKHLTVITNSIAVTLELASEDSIRVILIGGYHSKNSYSLVGNFAEKVIQDYHIDKFYFSCLGVDFERGISEIDEAQALVKRQILAVSEKMFLLADHTKFDRKSLFKLCDLSRIDYLITDDKVPIHTIKELNNRGIRALVSESS